MALLQVALISARTYLNDDAATNWTDASLVPKLQEAHRELQTMLWEVQSPFVRAETAGITVGIGATDLGGSAPLDMLTPFKLVDVSQTPPIDLTEVFYIPQGVTSAHPTFWAWRDNKIVFVGSSGAGSVKVFYRKLIPIPAAAGDEIGIPFGELYMGARAAAIAYGSAGNIEAYKIASDTAAANFKRVVAAHRGQQNPMYRP